MTRMGIGLRSSACHGPVFLTIAVLLACGQDLTSCTYSKLPGNSVDLLRLVYHAQNHDSKFYLLSIKLTDLQP